MRNTTEGAARGQRAVTLVAGSAIVLALMLAAIAIALNGQVERASARSPEPTTVAEDRRLVGDAFRRTELYFGSEKPGPDVTGRQFDRFVDREVTPRFPDGLTLLTGYGQFKGSDGKIVQERSFVLVLLYPPDDDRANREIQQIRNAYKDGFDQESVLRTDSRERVSF